MNSRARIPVDFHGRNLIVEHRIELLGRITARATYWLSIAAFVFVAVHAVLGFLTWPEPATQQAFHQEP